MRSGELRDGFDLGQRARGNAGRRSWDEAIKEAVGQLGLTNGAADVPRHLDAAADGVREVAERMTRRPAAYLSQIAADLDRIARHWRAELERLDELPLKD